MQGIKRKGIYNSEGYLDTTAYGAILNFYKGDRRKMTGWSNGDIIRFMLPTREYVWRIIVRGHGGYASTLNLFETKPFENAFKVNVDGKGEMYADLGKTAYMKKWDLDESDFVRAMDEKEYDRLLKRLGETLGIPKTVLPSEDGIDYKGECVKLQDEIDIVYAEKKKLENDYEGLRADMEHLVLKNKKMEEELEGLCDSAHVAEELGKKEDEIREAMAEITMLRAKLDYATSEGDEARTKVIRAEAERDVYKELYQQVLVKYTCDTRAPQLIP